LNMTKVMLFCDDGKYEERPLTTYAYSMEVMRTL
jgi:hypothetical protein